jgi:hypothetical protein
MLSPAHSRSTWSAFTCGGFARSDVRGRSAAFSPSESVKAAQPWCVSGGRLDAVVVVVDDVGFAEFDGEASIVANGLKLPRIVANRFQSLQRKNKVKCAISLANDLSKSNEIAESVFYLRLNIKNGPTSAS